LADVFSLIFLTLTPSERWVAGSEDRTARTHLNAVSWRPCHDHQLV